MYATGCDEGDRVAAAEPGGEADVRVERVGQVDRSGEVELYHRRRAAAHDGCVLGPWSDAALGTEAEDHVHGVATDRLLARLLRHDQVDGVDGAFEVADTGV